MGYVDNMARCTLFFLLECCFPDVNGFITSAYLCRLVLVQTLRLFKVTLTPTLSQAAKVPAVR